MAVRKQSAGHVQATIEVSDIEIGAVELKDDDSDVRQSVALVTLFNAGYAQSEDGAHVTAGATTDAAASSTVAEDATARTGIGLWKGIKNILILVNAWVSSLGTTTDAAAASDAAEDATARTSIGLLKGIKNILVLINAKLAALGQAAMDASMPVVIASNQTDVPVAVATATSGGCSIFRSLDLDESEEEVKATAGQLYGGIVMNMSAAALYLKFYNATAANVTVGTTVPVMTIPIPTPGDTDGAGFVIPIPAQGIAFGTAITVAATTGIADNDSGAPGANEVVVNLWYA